MFLLLIPVSMFYFRIINVEPVKLQIIPKYVNFLINYNCA